MPAAPLRQIGRIWDSGKRQLWLPIADFGYPLLPSDAFTNLLMVDILSPSKDAQEAMAQGLPGYIDEPVQHGQIRRIGRVAGTTLMCNLYRLSKSQSEVAAFFRDISPDLAPPPPGNAGEEVYPGYPGVVLAEGRLRQMAWGFPLVLKGAQGQNLRPKPVNNARTDKLATPFWSASFRNRRCLIPATGWAEAEGVKGAMTRTWIAPPGQPIFAIAGIWRGSDEWGDVYSMVMTDASPAMQGLHTRMPMLLAPGDWRTWASGSTADALALCQPWAGALALDRTCQPWVKRR